VRAVRRRYARYRLPRAVRFCVVRLPAASACLLSRLLPLLIFCSPLRPDDFARQITFARPCRTRLRRFTSCRLPALLRAHYTRRCRSLPGFPAYTARSTTATVRLPPHRCRNTFLLILPLPTVTLYLPILPRSAVLRLRMVGFVTELWNFVTGLKRLRSPFFYRLPFAPVDFAYQRGYFSTCHPFAISAVYLPHCATCRCAFAFLRFFGGLRTDSVLSLLVHAAAHRDTLPLRSCHAADMPPAFPPAATCVFRWTRLLLLRFPLYAWFRRYTTFRLTAVSLPCVLRTVCGMRFTWVV